MTAGNNGGAMPPDNDDDPFGYLYRPDGQSSGQAASPSRGPASYHNVRPVGERTFGGQQGYRPQPDARYAAPEAQVGAPAPAPAGPRRAAPEPPRRNGLLIGAIAVVLAVVAGVGAAILFSSGGEEETAGGDPTPAPTATEDEENAEGSEGDDDENEPEEPEALPTAGPADVELSGGAAIESELPGASTEDGSYIAILGRQDATITWTFELPEGGSYELFTEYATVSDGQTMSFSVNGTPRDDAIDTRDYGGTGDWESSWYDTYNYVDLTEGTNTIQLTCGDSCDIAIQRLSIRERG
ncbi:carbohydrate-binding protein [Streptomyces sp. 7-21]|uniref:carbohydrate-binding protein n=1 Tax=Streptomyces sp. 7-21 TaxID=2802283 RepID=UPI00191DE1C7|nr:carbohydrate-binding protein [Streptomyces sp. 7-21]MBL1067573.1 carbohydrate-binding protein [Streptomyces sp. 7-21]